MPSGISVRNSRGGLVVCRYVIPKGKGNHFHGEPR